MKRETTTIIVITLGLMLLGQLMVYSVCAVKGKYDVINMNLIYACFSTFVLFTASRFDYRHFQDGFIFRSLVMLTLAFLVAVLIIGHEVDGGKRWLILGPLRFQPSELAKFTLIVLLAVKLTQNRDEIKTFFKGFLPPLFLSGLFVGLILLERDLGNPAMLVGITGIMLFVAGVRLRYLMISAIPVIAGVVALIYMAPHRMRRMAVFVDPFSDVEVKGWQLVQSLSAFAQGGIFGTGIGAGEQKLGYLPAAHTDFIYAIVAEELGLVGTMTVLILYAILGIAAFRIAMHAQDRFGSLLATGIAGLITLQATFMMAVTTGLLPTKGLPLPFVSYGGTALIIMMGLVGILVNIGAQSPAPETVKRGLVPAT